MTTTETAEVTNGTSVQHPLITAYQVPQTWAWGRMNTVAYVKSVSRCFIVTENLVTHRNILRSVSREGKTYQEAVDYYGAPYGLHIVEVQFGVECNNEDFLIDTPTRTDFGNAEHVLRFIHSLVDQLQQEGSYFESYLDGPIANEYTSGGIYSDQR